MTTDGQARHLKYGRFSRRHTERVLNGADPHRRGHWTGYRPLEDTLAQARLTVPSETVEEQTEDRA